MLAAVAAEIDVGDRSFEQCEDRLFDAVCIAHEREHRSVVRWIGGVVEQAHSRHGADGRGHGRDDLRTAAFAHIGNAFDQHKGVRF